MSNDECITEYINQVVENIRWKRVVHSVSEELSSTIYTSIEEYIREGLTETAATQRILSELGEADSVGKKLDHVYRPFFPRKIILFICISIIFGVFLSFVMHRIFDTIFLFEELMVTLGIGILIMIIMYFCNYTLLLKYPRGLYFICLAELFVVFLYQRNEGGWDFVMNQLLFQSFIIIPLVWFGMIHSAKRFEKFGMLYVVFYMIPPMLLAVYSEAGSILVYLFLTALFLLIYGWKLQCFQGSMKYNIFSVVVFVIFLAIPICSGWREILSF